MDIGALSAKELGAQIAAGNISSRAATEYYIERIKTHNETINAVIDERFDKALAEASAADEDVVNGKIKGALHGVPMTIKDAYEVEGLSCAVGAPQFSNHISQEDAVVVQRLKAAGAIMLGKTNTPLFCADLQSYNELHGVTNNPYNLEHTPGGSSGGSAAALAAGMTPLEYGSDIGGSIRTPAHFCGLFGHKPSFGIVPKRGHVPPLHGSRAETEFSVAGPLARSVADLELAFDLTIGLQPPHNHAMQLHLQAPRATSPKDLRIGLWADDPYCEIDSELRDAIEVAAKKLEAEGAQIIDAKPDFTLAHHTEVYATMMPAIMASGFSPEQIEAMGEIAKAAPADDKSLPILQARAAGLSYRDWMLWNEERAILAEKMEAFFQKADVLFCPITPTPAMPHSNQIVFHERIIEVNGKPRSYFENIVWAGISILTGNPSTAVPLTRHSSGLPMGMQVVGPAYEDRTTIAVARMLETLGYQFQKPAGY